MSKKNKDIEVRLEEEKTKVNGQELTITKLLIGKKEIGRITPKDAKRFTIEMDGSSQGVVRSIDEGIEAVIRQWNLSE